jgi:hypothetical protein
LHSKAEDDAHHADHLKALINPAVDVVAMEKEKVQGALRTDFILSAEIIAITLGTVADAPFGQQVLVLTGIAAIMTAGVYGLVAGIVKLDDLGLYLTKKSGGLPRSIGAAILKAAPYMMKTLSVVGTAAMFMVGGGILTHGIPAAHHFIERAAHAAGAIPGIGGLLEAVTPTLLSAVAGIVAGAIVLAGVTIAGRVFRRTKAQS